MSFYQDKKKFRDQKAFIEEVISRDLLDDTINWIKNNCSPEEVFTVVQLEQWAEENDYILNK